MGFNGPAHAALNHDATRSATEFRGAGVRADNSRGARERVKPRHQPAATIPGAGSLGQAFAGIPEELDLPSSVRFRVVVLGRQRPLRRLFRDEVYRIGLEAIVNAYRHSGAKEIETEIEFRPDGLRVGVRDNGCGIDPQELGCGSHGPWGLQGMRERAECIGGRLRVLSRVDLGTEVELCVAGKFIFEQGSNP